MMDYKHLLDREIKTIADNFDIDALFTTILVENRKGGVDVGMLFNKTEEG
jgi:hypothetical protein